MPAPPPSLERGNPLAGLPNIRPRGKDRSVLIVPPRACEAARRPRDEADEGERS